MKLSASLSSMAVLLSIAITPAAANDTGGGWQGDTSTSYVSGAFGRTAELHGRRARTDHRARIAPSGVSSSVGGVGPRPRKWCGWYMRTRLGGGPAFNIAANWRRYGSPTVPQIGAVVVWPHHVGIITGRTADGRWIITSGNDGGRLKSRVWPLKGAVFRI